MPTVWIIPVHWGYGDHCMQFVRQPQLTLWCPQGFPGSWRGRTIWGRPCHHGMDVTHGCSMSKPSSLHVSGSVFMNNTRQSFQFCDGCFQTSIRRLVPCDTNTWAAWNKERCKKTILLSYIEQGRPREERFKSDIKVFSSKGNLSGSDSSEEI